MPSILGTVTSLGRRTYVRARQPSGGTRVVNLSLTKRQDLKYAEPYAAGAASYRSNKGGKSDTEVSKDQKLVKHEHHANSAEEGDTANIKQNTTNKGFFRGRRIG